MTPLPEEGSTTGEMVLATAHLGTNLAVLLGGAVLGTIIAPGESKVLGTIIGAGAGALIGRAIDDGDIVCR